MKPVAAAAICALAAAAGAMGARPAEAPEPIASKGSFSVCVDPTFPPLEYYAKVGSTTTLTGFDVDVARAVAKRWRVKMTFVPTTFTRLMPALGSHKCDVIWSAILVTPERTKRFPAVGYMKTHRVLLVKAGNPKRIRSPSDLSGKTAATQAGTVYVDTLKALDRRLRAQGKQGVRILTYRKASAGAAAVLAGRAAADLTDDTEAAFRISQNKGRFQIGYRYPQFDTFGIYYRRSDADVGPAIRRELRALRQNGRLRTLAKKYKLPLRNLGLN